MAKQEKDELQESRDGIRDNIRRWKDILDHGCNDPFWPDGSNMNLCRNHVIYYKYRVREICGESGEPFPEEYYLPTPPEVSSRYMARASFKQTGRIERLLHDEPHFETQKVRYDEAQLSFY